VSIPSIWGLVRSLVIYYGQPWRRARMRRFYGQFITPGALAFDVGAHVGNRVGAWRVLGAQVVAIEPQPSMVRMLERLYGRDDQVTVKPIGLSDAPGQLTLQINTRNPTLSTFSDDWVEAFSTHPDISAASFDDTATVRISTLDALIETHGLPAFCKIDVEGFEDKVLAGLSVPIQAVSFEAFPLEVERSIRCVQRLMALGHYRFRTVMAEQFRWADEDWMDADAMVARLRAWDLEAGSGDVYARLYSI
jgi:FkbM family methyltransferase